jgi:hypothetical protein
VVGPGKANLGHDASRYLKPYAERQKNDAADAEAICDAVTRPTMRLVEIKSGEQQSITVPCRPTCRWRVGWKWLDRASELSSGAGSVADGRRDPIRDRRNAGVYAVP